MGKLLYIADTHFGHENIIHYDNRPFFTAAEMEKTLVERWNTAVTQNDTVCILGDFCWGDEKEWMDVLRQLRGRKILVRGNHDPKRLSHELWSQFSDVIGYAEVVDNGRHVVLCHYPMPCFKNQFKGWYHLYGHVHGSFEANMMEHDKRLIRDLYGKECRMYNVGCMMPWMDYTPRTLDEIIARCDDRGAAHE